MTESHSKEDISEGQVPCASANDRPGFKQRQISGFHSLTFPKWDF